MAKQNNFLRVSMFGAALWTFGAAGHSMASTASPACLDQFYQAAAPQLQNEKLKANTTPLCLNGFNALHSGVSKTSLWVAEALTPERLSIKIARKDSFHEENQVPAQQRATLEDYRGSGYDRGHMAPNADMPTKAAQHDSFSLANMVPQTPQNNQQVWRELEEGVRAYVTKQQKTLYVITGPDYSGKVSTIGKNKVLVPTATYKAVYSPDTGMVGAYYVSNDMKVAKPQVERISICALEQKIGINLFPKLKEQDKRQVYALPLSAGQVKANQSIQLLSTDEKSTCAAQVTTQQINANKKLFKPSADYEGTMVEVLAKKPVSVDEPQPSTAPSVEAPTQENVWWKSLLRELLNFLVQLLK